MVLAAAMDARYRGTTRPSPVLEYLQELSRSGANLEAALTDSARSPRERLDALFDIPDPGTGPVRGCPFLDAAAEYPDPVSAVHAFARARRRSGWST